jgi:hypothetical protein
MCTNNKDWGMSTGQVGMKLVNWDRYYGTTSKL